MPYLGEWLVTVFAALFAYPFLARRLAADDPLVDSHVCTRPLEVPVRAGLVLGGTAFVAMLTLVTTGDTLTKALHAPVEVVIWVFPGGRAGRPGGRALGRLCLQPHPGAPACPDAGRGRQPDGRAPGADRRR